MCRCRTGDEDCCCCSVGAAAKISLLVLALSCSIEGVAAVCIAAAPGVAAARAVAAAAAAAAAAGVAAARGGDPQEAIRPSSWWSRIMCVVGTGYVSRGPKAAVPRNPDGKNNEKTTNNVT